MKIRHFIILTALYLFLYANQMYGQSKQEEQGVDSTLINTVYAFIENWHHQASVADIAYFDKIADDGIYIGTDATELWTNEEFYVWAKKYFDRGKAWSFTTIERNIYFSNDKQYAWFDELLNTGMGVCRASGVILKKKGEWKIAHYHLSIAIPNENVEQIKTIIEGNK